jgi:peptidyl-prolyl cis-trans isomerase D
VSRAGDADDLLWSEPNLLSAAFGPEVMANGENSEPVDLDGDKIVVVRLSEHRPSADQSIDDVRANIVASLRDDAAKAAALETATQLLKGLREGQSLDAAAMQASGKWSSEKAISRNDFDVSNAVRETLFRIPRPTDQKPGYDAAVDDAGNVHVLALSGVEEEATLIEPATLTAARRGLAQITGNSTFRSFVAGLRADAEVDVFSERL